MPSINRRLFLAGSAAILPAARLNAHAELPITETARLGQAAEIRLSAAKLQSLRSLAPATTNGDEERFADRIGSYSKGLPHDAQGEVSPQAYNALLTAMRTGRHDDFERIPRAGGKTLSNPQSAFSFHLEGGDPHTFPLAAPPSIATAESKADIEELYWQALCRDVPFSQYETSPLIARAAQSLKATPATVFRGPVKTDRNGPYISQFLLKPIAFGATRLEQRYQVPKPGSDFMTTFGEWVQIRDGFQPWRDAEYDPVPRYLRNGRDLAEYVHYDFAYQAGLGAALILINSSAKTVHNCNQFKSGNNPYRYSTVEDGFATFGPPEAIDWIGRVTTAALKTAYYQKWAVHRRLRPEDLGALIHKTRTGVKKYPIHESLLNFDALDATYAAHQSYFLPQAYPEGCPLHPSFPSGHAAIIGAASVVLKACYDGTMLLPGCVEPNADGTQLVPCKDYSPTVNAEINKLAFNVAMGRGWAGIHYRTDHLAGLQLGEAVGISILQDLVRTYSESFKEFTLERFDGSTVHIRTNGEITVTT